MSVIPADSILNKSYLDAYKQISAGPNSIFTETIAGVKLLFYIQYTELFLEYHCVGISRKTITVGSRPNNQEPIKIMILELLRAALPSLVDDYQASLAKLNGLFEIAGLERRLELDIVELIS